MVHSRRYGGFRAGLCGFIAAAAMAAGCTRQEASVPTTLLGVPSHVNEHVSATSDGQSLVALAWAATSESTGTNIFAAVSVDGGASFSEPVRVNAVERQANVNGEQPPRVALGREADGRPSIVVLWTAKGDGGTALLSARSVDGGRTFGPTVSLPGVDAPGNRGWESLASASGGQLYALWLDHRDGAAASGAHAPHQHGAGAAQKMDGVARAQRSQLFVSTLDGRVEPKAIARGVCYCCKTALATGPDGTVYAAWRHVYEGNYRDVAFTLSRDGGRSFEPPVRISEDRWQLDGCPENGPALGVDRSNRVHVVWPTLVQTANGETLKLFHASTVDGREFTPRAELPTRAAAYHPQLTVAPDGSLVVAWDELASGARRVRAVRGESDERGRITFSASTVDEVPGAYPALAATSSHAIVAWAQRGEDASRIAVRRLPFGR